MNTYFKLQIPSRSARKESLHEHEVGSHGGECPIEADSLSVAPVGRARRAAVPPATTARGPRTLVDYVLRYLAFLGLFYYLK